MGTLSYNGKRGKLCVVGIDAVDWYKIASRLVQDICRFGLPHSGLIK